MPCHCWARSRISLCISFVAEFRCDRCKSARVLSFSERWKTVGNSIAETDVAMELCKKVQVEEYVIHVEESTNFYTHLRFFLLASTWFPRRVGVCLWNALHMFLVLYEALMLLVLSPIVFVLAVLLDYFMVAMFICMLVAICIYTVLLFPFTAIFGIPVKIIFAALVWLWVMINCQCCPLPVRAPGQGLVDYIFTAGVTPGAQNPQPEPAEERGVFAADGPLGFLRTGYLTRRFVRHVILVSFPYRRAQLGDSCREIVPWCDTIVM